jgi:hypothetical protein
LLYLLVIYFQKFEPAHHFNDYNLFLKRQNDPCFFGKNKKMN